MLLGVALLILMMVLAMISDDVSFIAYKKERHVADDLGFMLQNELFLASEVHDGYTRTISLQERYDGVRYNVTIIGRTLVVRTDIEGIEQPFYIPDVVGDFKKGENTIRKQGGVIYLN